MIEAVLVRAASHGLVEPDSAPVELTRDHVDEAVAQAHHQHITGLLDQAVADGAVACDEDAVVVVSESAVRVAASTLRAERHHLTVHSLLEGAGIEHRFLKGPSVAHRFHAHPALRPFADVDVLVRPGQIDEAVRAASGAGHRRLSSQLVDGFDRRWGKSVTLRSDSAGVELDLHRVLASGPYGAVAPPTAIWDREEVHIVVGGVRLPVLDAPSTFVHACVHAVTGRLARLGSLRDVLTVGGALSADDRMAARDLARSLQVGACVTRALDLAQERLGVAPPAPLLTAGVRPLPERDARWLVQYAERSDYSDLARAAWWATPGAARRFRYALDLARARRAHRRGSKR